MINFTCQHCGAPMQVEDDFAGRRGACNRCSAALVVPVPSLPPLTEIAPVRHPGFVPENPRVMRKQVTPVAGRNSIVGIFVVALAIVPIVLFAVAVVLLTVFGGIEDAATPPVAAAMEVAPVKDDGAIAFVADRDIGKEVRRLIQDPGDRKAPLEARAPRNADPLRVSGGMRFSQADPKLFASGASHYDFSTYTVISLSITNVTKTKKVDLAGWGSNSGPTLTDEFGNRYKRLHTGDVSGQFYSKAIYPGDTVTDVLVFQLPVKQARKFTLTLPRENYDEKGNIVIGFEME